MKHRLLYYLFAIFLLSLGGCMQDDMQLPQAIEQEGDDVTVRFSVNIPEYKTVQTRANGGVNDLFLLVFDDNGNFIARRQATLSDQTETGGKFTASLPSSTSHRNVHFVSNYDWAGFNDQYAVGINEASIVALMSTSNVAFWSRVELTNGISSTTFSGQTVELLRNQSKISVTNEASNFTYEGFTIHNRPSAGTVAPFSTATSLFTEGVITEPSGVGLITAQTSDISTSEKYLFERKNANASNITTVIVKGKYEGQTYYYKIDLIDADKNRYDIQRNYHYVVKIQTVTRAGYTSFNDALTGASHNNTALDPIIEKYPIISDGTSKLEVEKTLVVLTDAGEQFSVWAKYYPDLNSNTVDNSGVTATIQSGNEAIDESTFSFNQSTGVITAKGKSPMPSEVKEGRIVVTKDDLARVIRVVQRSPFSFTPVTINNGNPGSVLNGQSRDATLRFNIPSDFPEDLFPHPIRIYAQGLYPAASGLEMVVENGIMSYIYMATSTGQQTINFKTNKSNNAETVSLKADYFTDGSVAYSTTNSISGNITYGGQNVPSGANVTQSTGNIEINQNGKFEYGLPANYTNNTDVTFTYIRSVNANYSEEYKVTTTIGNLISNESINLNLENYIFEGTIKYGNGNDVPTNSGTVSKTSGPGDFQMNGTGKYIYSVTYTTDNNTSVSFRYRTGGFFGIGSTTYTQSRTISQLKNNSNLQLTN